MVVCASSKRKDTWYAVLEHYDAKCDSARRNSQKVVVRMASHTFLRNSNGNRYFLYLYRDDDGRWNWNYNWLDNNRNVANVSAVLGNSLHFSPRVSGAEFCFVSCPFQPPSILPTSSSGRESAAYFFVSSDFVSQSTRSKTFNVSSLRMASRTHGCFSFLERKVAEAIASIASMNSASTFPPRVWRCTLGSV